MRIISLTAENFKRLRAVKIRPDGSLIPITGPNGAGKSTILDALFSAIAGRTYPKSPIRDGELKATITVDMGELIVTRRFTPSGTTLEVASPNGAVFKKPQEVLDALGKLMFDPLAFARLSSKDQLEQLRRIVTVDEDLDALDAQIARAFAERTEVNREVKSLTERVASLGAGLDLEADTEPVNVRALLDQLQTASAHNAAIEVDRDRRARAAGELAAMEQEITDLEEQIARLRGRQTIVRATITERMRTAATEAPLAEPIDVTLLRAAVDEGTAENAARAQLERNRSEHRKAIDQLTARRADAENLTATMDAAAARKRAAIARAAMPIEGLSFGDGEITFRGVPFAQASSAEQLRVAVAIGMALNPKLRLLTVKDGSLLDSTSLAMLEQMAEENDFQVWMEVVKEDASVGIHIVDGSVAAINGEPVSDPDALVEDEALVEA